MKEQEQISLRGILETPYEFMMQRGIVYEKVEPLMIHGIDVKPYILALQRLPRDAQTVFYVNFNKTLSSVGGIVDQGKTIQNINDIQTLTQLLCWVFFVQEYCVP